MYFTDLSPYTYSMPLAEGRVVLNVGWLDNRHEFPKGEVSDDVLGVIFHLCRNPVNKMRGSHSCEYCPERWGCIATRGGVELGLGNGEIRVPGSEGIVYASPCMIYHYIAEHEYKPPQAYIEAVLKLT